jgi:hypothetical protein
LSIYSSWLDIDDNDHEDTCDVYEHMGTGSTWPEGAVMAQTASGDKRDFYRLSGKPCTCPNKAPIIYQGSHVNPSDDDPRGGCIDVAAIPNFLHPNVRHSRPNTPYDGEDMRFPVEFLRLTVDEDKATYHGGQPGLATVVLDRQQVEKLRDTLTDWLNTKERY